jgi:CMP-N,N'-diacetyllegionaminic acid synthase
VTSENREPPASVEWPSAVALVPARAGSTRVPQKNIRPLAGKPLLAHTIASALEAGVFEAVVVSTDSAEIAEIAQLHGAEILGLRPAEMATATSPDIEWVEHVLDQLHERGRDYDAWGLLRPTSPFRSPASIRAAFAKLVAHGDDADSIRAVEKVRQHPAKMWTLDGDFVVPLLPQPEGEVALHSRQFHALPEVYVQDSSLELAWTRVVRDGGGISGTRVLAWFPPGSEGFSIDYPDDWEQAERLIARGSTSMTTLRV